MKNTYASPVILIAKFENDILTVNDSAIAKYENSLLTFDWSNKTKK